MAKGIGLLSLCIILTEQPFTGELIRRKEFGVHHCPGAVVSSMNSGIHITTGQADGAIAPHGLSGWCVVNF